MIPADTTPDQLAAALAEIAKRDNVSISMHIRSDGSPKFDVFEWTKSGLLRHGHADTYSAALSACRAAEFKGVQS